ncbi:hypothetical protein PIB30_103895 [Stylosanthes scabra]|uniref:Uncharacterized protein n=1 Tax=Stylosanthes scabra TaxID=79078 RepID=A0ABU6ZWV6_9FABA|nr:hypothetical protein [Stylosanthes scabra]
MEVLSMFQRPRSVALEYEKPGTYGKGLIPPTRPFDRVWLRGLRDNHPYLGLVIIIRLYPRNGIIGQRQFRLRLRRALTTCATSSRTCSSNNMISSSSNFRGLQWHDGSPPKFLHHLQQLHQLGEGLVRVVAGAEDDEHDTSSEEPSLVSPGSPHEDHGSNGHCSRGSVLFW